ncbi:MAG: glycoside hydrolase family 3 N-terminal domain-containing protein [Chloroflexota bacterium]
MSARKFRRPSGWVLALLALESVIFLALASVGAWLLIDNLLPNQPTPASQVNLPTTTVAPIATSSPTLLPTPLPSTTPAPSLTPTFTASPSPTLTPTTTLDPWVDQVLAEMSLEQKIGQMLLIGVDGTQVTNYSCSLVQRFLPGGVVYRGGNVISPDQLYAFSSGLQACSQQVGGLPLWIAMDHEGQYVNRFLQGAAIFPSAMALGATGNPELAYQAAYASGLELAYSGVNLVLGPVADVLINYDNDVISIRSYGDQAQIVGEFVSQSVRGYLQAGVVPVLKHFPGHGGTTGDTHELLAIDNASLAQLQQTHLPPFQSGLQAGAPVVMFSHVAFPAVDGSVQPASLSPNLVALLRQDLGYQGFILTDSMGMGAIKNNYGSVGQASVLAVSAGVDMLLTTSAESAQSAYSSVQRAVQDGNLDPRRIDEAVRHILQVKAAYHLRAYPQAQALAPDWAADQKLADEIGYRSITVIQDDAGLLPLPPAPQRILAVGPQESWGLYPALQAALGQSGYKLQLVTYSGPWNGPVTERSYLNTLPIQASQFDLVLVFTWQAHLNRLRYADNFQAALVNNLLATGRPVLVVMLKSPTDLLEFPGAPGVLATFGTTQGQIQGLVDALVGRYQPVGQNPLQGLP